jgi:hypothetical protein
LDLGTETDLEDLRSVRERSRSETNHYVDTTTMKRAAQVQPGLLADIATLMAMAENFLDILERGVEPGDPRVWKRPLIKRNKKGEEKTYYRWYCSWHDGNKTITEYLGSCRKMSETEAFEKAKRLKSEALPGAEKVLEQCR